MLKDITKQAGPVKSNSVASACAPQQGHLDKAQQNRRLASLAAPEVNLKEVPATKSGLQVACKASAPQQLSLATGRQVLPAFVGCCDGTLSCGACHEAKTLSSVFAEDVSGIFCKVLGKGPKILAQPCIGGISVLDARR